MLVAAYPLPTILPLQALPPRAIPLERGPLPRKGMDTGYGGIDSQTPPEVPIPRQHPQDPRSHPHTTLHHPTPLPIQLFISLCSFYIFFCSSATRSLSHLSILLLAPPPLLLPPPASPTTASTIPRTQHSPPHATPGDCGLAP
ncbi:uncharacterized protein LOC62_02G002711 [Vanrija pseudolonga]|uniref:Uncharacterized protein n=1 Tax=Vanrija pseudolonga TaxID=143232 RepID=A0AAF0Y354_9TREE|nr:hypothetical protein LOC62_02G002711 [Vanrija pseudolonga]